MADKSASAAPQNKAPESDGEPMTPSDHSDAEHDDDSDSDRDDSDYQSEDGTDDSSEGDVDKPNIKWTGYNKKVPVIMFHSEAVLQNISKYKKVGERFHMGFKFGSTESRIIRTVLLAHGFHEVSSNNSDFNMLWTGGHLKPLTLRSMSEFQKINHFPRSYELTRKDRLYKNVQRMQQIKGSRNFNFVPMSFVIPAEYQEFCAAFSRDKGPWIIKPVASSRGRGVHLVNHPDQVPLEENLIISRYILNPLLIDGFKFDVRLYVAVTSYDPLVIYLYEEGLTRFATVRYEKSNRNLRNQCMHLTNYSVNKKSNGYVKNDDPDIEDYGNKWSLGALLRYLKRLGTDTAALMMKIEDVIVKTILSAELHIAAATKMFVNNKWNCFELYGFDILIDDTMKPWILEVNLSPSLVCDSPLDLKIKTNLVCDLFSAIGIVCHDPILKNYQQTRKNREFAAQMNCGRSKRRPASAGASTSSSHGNRTSYFRRGMSGLNSEEIKIVRRIKEEETRKGGWVRLFPSPDSWDLYSPFLQFATTHNLMLHQRLYPHRHKTMMYKCLSPVTSLGSRAKMVYNNLANSVSNLSKFENENCESFVQAQRRALQYERKLEERRVRPRKPRRGRSRRAKKSKSPSEAITSHAILADKVATTSSSSPTKPFFYSSLDGLDKVSSSYCTLSRTCPSPIAGMSAYSSQAPSETLLDYSKNKDLTSQIDAALQKVDIIEILENGGNLSQLQARTAFALYLNKVQQRLLKEATSTEEGNVDSLNDQMDLVLRFLKRAAVNLQRNFRVVVPSKKLPLKERARILAKELAEFVQHYKKETLQLKKTLQNEMKDDITQPISAEDFNRFLQYSNESELEMVLTTYAKLKKSASIFLGESTTASLDDSQSSSISSTSPKEGKVSTNPKKEGTHRGKKNTSPPKTSRIPTQRPASASSSRCLSAATQDISVDTYNERAIQDALQNLVAKQQLRQYSAHRGTGILSSKICDSKPSALSLNKRSKSLDRKSSKSCCMASASSMSNINRKENLYIGLGKSVSDTIATTADHTHSHEVCFDANPCKHTSASLGDLNSSKLEQPLQIDGASLSCKTIGSLDTFHLKGESFLISQALSTSSSGDHHKKNPNNANNNNNNNNFCSNKIKTCNDKINSDKSSLQHLKKMVLPPAYPSSLPLYFTSITGSQPDKRGGQCLRSPKDPLQKHSESYLLPTANNELISAVSPSQKFFQQWKHQLPVHQQSQLLHKQHIKKHAKLHNLVLQKSAPLPSPSFDFTVKQQQSVFTPRPPVHRPRKATNLYKANSCLIPQPSPKSGEQKTRRVTSSYKTL